MEHICLDIIDTLIEINNYIHSDYSNKDALQFRILRSVMRLVKCERVDFIVIDELSNQLKLSASIDEDKEIKYDFFIRKDFLTDLVLTKKDFIIVNNVNAKTPYSFEPNNKDFLYVLAIPIITNNNCVAVIQLLNNLAFTKNDLSLMQMLGNLSANAYYNVDCFDFLKKHSNTSNNTLIKSCFNNFADISPVMQDLMSVVKQAALSSSPVLITGEFGTEKEFIAEKIYLNSNKADNPFFKIDCNTEESRFVNNFFSDKNFQKISKCTLFIKNVDKLSISLQSSLLNLIKNSFSKTFSSEKTFHDIRIIASTNRNMEEMLKDGSFLEELFFRLNLLPIRIPPLRTRKKDILLLAKVFLKKYSHEIGKFFTCFSDSAIKLMEEYDWPGNINELENIIAASCIIGNPPVIKSRDLRLKFDCSDNSLDANEAAQIAISNESRSLKNAVNSFKRSYITKILEECSWNQTKAGIILDIQRTYVSRLMNELHIRPK